MLRRLPWLLVLAACGSSAPADDAGAPDGATGTHPTECAADFPCFRSWACADQTHWLAQQTQPCEVVCHTTNCTGASCASVGDPQACPSGTECIDPQTTAAGYSGPPCAFGGIAGCAADDEQGFTPSAPVAPTKTAGVCADVDIQQFWARCFDPSIASDGQCTYWRNAHPDCGACLAPIFVDVPFATYSAEYSFPNVAGCYATLDGTTAPGSCAALEAANFECAVASCSNACAETEDAFDACLAAARTTTCAAFPRCEGEASTSFATCSASAPADFYAAFGKALCGAP